MVNWGVLGIICGVCAAPFTGGASLTVCAACAGIGFVGGKVIEAAVESGNDKPNNQAPPEAYNLLNKSIEEINKLREELRQQHEEGANKANRLENRLKEAQAKQRDPNLTKEEKEQWKNEELLIINELRKQRQNNDELWSQLKKLEKNQANAITAGANAAGGSINGANWGNTVDNLKPNFTTKLIIAGAVALIIYLLVAKGN